MASKIFKGGLDAQKAGDLDGTPDLRIMLVMTAFSGLTDGDVVNVADITTVDEFDGIGYVEYDAVAVAWSWDTGSGEWRLTFTNGGGDEFGDPVAAGSDVIHGLLVKLYVDGTDANDVVVGFTGDGGGFGSNANAGPVGITLPAAGLLFHREA